MRNHLNILTLRWRSCWRPIHPQRRIRISPEAAPAHYNAGIAYSQLGRFQEAIEAQKIVIRINPDFAPAHHAMGHAFLQRGDKTGALRGIQDT